MEIISHRGYWSETNEKNSLVSFKKSFDIGFGIETDIRDFNDNIVISHDVPKGVEVNLDSLISIMPLDIKVIAWNIKSDGLVKKIKNLFDKNLLEKSYFFDMSIPETLVYKKEDLNYLVRLSEYETINQLYPNAKGVWLDSFHTDWWELDIIRRILEDRKKVFVVSPELHSRDHRNVWRILKEFDNKEIILCTDFPTKAKEYFNE